MQCKISDDLIDITLNTGKQITLTFPELTQVEDIVRTIRHIQKEQTIKELKIET